MGFLPRGSFARSVAVITSGTAIGQLIVAGSAPLLTRLYTPAELGVLAVFTSTLSLLLVVASLRYELALPLTRSVAGALNTLALCGSIALLLSATVGLILWMLSPNGLSWFGLAELRPYLWLLPVSLFLAGLNQALSFWAVRQRAYSVIARTRMAQAAGLVGTQLLGGAAGFGAVALLAGDVVGRIGGTLSFLRLVRRDVSTSKARLSGHRVRAMARRYRRFPLISSGSALVNAAGLQLPTILLAAYHGPAIAGLFALAQRIVAVPMKLTGEAIGQVYLSTAADVGRASPGQLRTLYLRTLRKLLWVGVPMVSVVAVLGGTVFGSLFGRHWAAAGTYSQLLAIGFLGQFAVAPLSQTLNILERQDLQLFWDAGRLLVTIGTIVLPSEAGWEPTTTIAAFAGGLSLAYAAHVSLCLYAMRRNGCQLARRAA